MLQINKNNNHARPTIQILGSDKAQVKEWTYFFYNRGAIDNLWPIGEDWEPDMAPNGKYLVEFSCDRAKLIAAFAFSAKLPGGRKYRKLMKDSIKKQVIDYALDRIKKLGQIQTIRFAHSIDYYDAEAWNIIA